MFTGIIEQIGTVKHIETEGTNLHITMESSFVDELKIDQSIAHNGCCLTVVSKTDSTYVVTAIEESLLRTNIGDWTPGKEINLERCIQWNGRLDGHIVQGHVDTMGTCTDIKDRDGSTEFFFSYPEEKTEYVTVPKGSITVNGTSLTVVHSAPGEFSIAIIPYTIEHTNFRSLSLGDRVNLEFDILGKYVAQYMQRLQ